MSDYETVCEEAARAGGAVLLSWRGRFRAREKAPADLVTEADLASQEVIAELVLGRFPDHAFLGEEGDAPQASGAEYRWIVDPLDGTTNYVHGLNNYSVSVALEQNGQIIAGAVFDPVADECFTTARGGGARLNGRPIHVSGVSDLPQALVAVSLPPQINLNSQEVSDLIEIMLRSQAIRRMGSAALNLCYLADGRLDGYWAASLKIWDIAAGLLLVSEAGGVLTSQSQHPLDISQRNLVAAASEELHVQLGRLVGGRVES